MKAIVTILVVLAIAVIAMIWLAKRADAASLGESANRTGGPYGPSEGIPGAGLPPGQNQIPASAGMQVIAPVVKGALGSSIGRAAVKYAVAGSVSGFVVPTKASIDLANKYGGSVGGAKGIATKAIYAPVGVTYAGVKGAVSLGKKLNPF